MLLFNVCFSHTVSPGFLFDFVVGHTREITVVFHSKCYLKHKVLLGYGLSSYNGLKTWCKNISNIILYFQLSLSIPGIPGQSCCGLDLNKKRLYRLL